MIVEHLKGTPEVLMHPEMYLGFSIKVQQNAYDILDNPRMHEFGEYYKPTDEIIWSKVIVRQWKLAYNLTPYAVFPWHNSTLLKEQIANETDRIIALMIRWELPHTAWDLDNRSICHRGLDAMSYTLEQVPRIFEEIMKNYPNGTYVEPVTKEPRSYFVDFYGWIVDRATHGLYNSSVQLLGPIADSNIWRNLWENHKIDIDDYVVQNYPNSINAYLSKNYPHWKLIKFIEGYGGKYHGADDTHFASAYWPIVKEAFAIPEKNGVVYYEHYINAPARYAIAVENAYFGLPDSVIKPLKEGKFGEVLILPGNGFSCIGSPIEGVKKDIAYGQQNPVEANAKYIEISLPIRGYKIVLFKMGQRG